MVKTVTVVVLACLLAPGAAGAQATAPSDPILGAIRNEGTLRSRVPELAQTLLDSLGPRLTGSPGSEAASDWVIRTYTGWGIEARAERYGTWQGWRRGVTHLDLLTPRVRTLEATMLALSPGTRGPVTGPVLVIPFLDAPAERQAFLDRVRGAFVLLTPPELSCRPEESWERSGTPASRQRLAAERDSSRADWAARARSTGVSNVLELARLLEGAGAAGVLASEWSQGWGTQKIYQAYTERAPHLDVACEDYGLLWRLALRGQGPTLRLEADAEALGEVPVANTIGMIRGSEKPDEYVVLSAHFDSWDGASGATDNGTGTIAMMEAMRILSEVVPRPRRTILAGHWNGEEQGLNGSRAFAADHPEILAGMQALFNQDDGTGRVQQITMEGLVGPGERFREWLRRIPPEIGGAVQLSDPGTPGRGGTDNASFICAGAPAFGMNALAWDYHTYTWHTNRDTYDKLVVDDLKANATLIAMLAYLASEDPETMPRTQRELPVDTRSGQQPTWPTCEDARRSFGR